MVGFPTALNTKADYEYVRKNFPAEQWKPVYQALLDTMYEWFNTGTTDTETNDDTHKVVTDQQTGKKYQYEKKLNPDCKLMRLGYTESEVKEILGESV